MMITFPGLLVYAPSPPVNRRHQRWTPRCRLGNPGEKGCPAAAEDQAPIS
jgi:hypothetical protein